MASTVLRLSLLAVFCTAVFGCNPSQNPTTGETTVYQKVKFSMTDVRLDGRWTGPSTPSLIVPPQKAFANAVVGTVITNDLENIVDAVTATMNLPQDMVSVTVDPNSEVSNVTIDTTITTTCSETQKSHFTIQTTTGLVLFCDVNAAAAGAAPINAKFTITGQFASTVATTKTNWQLLADAVQTKLGSENFGFVEFDDDDKIDITV